MKNSILNYAKDENPEVLGKTLERALGVLRFSVNATTTLTTFDAHHRREANTVLRNLTKKSSHQHLDWSNILNKNLHF